MGDVAIKLETYNKLRDDIRKLKEKNQELEKQLAFLAQDLEDNGQKIICKTKTIRRWMGQKPRNLTPYNLAFSGWECMEESVSEDFVLINFEDVEDEVRKTFKEENEEEMELLKAKCEKLESQYKAKCDEVADAYMQLRELKERNLWQRILNKD